MLMGGGAEDSRAPQPEAGSLMSAGDRLEERGHGASQGLGCEGQQK